MGLSGEHCITTVMREAMVRFVETAECSYNEAMMVYQCLKGDSVAYPNKQTYEAIRKGYCVPSCNLDARQFKCQFESWFREETVVKESDLDEAPFTVIRGVDYANADNSTSDPESFPESMTDLFAATMFEFDVPEEEEEEEDRHEKEKEKTPEVIPITRDREPYVASAPEPTELPPTPESRESPASQPEQSMQPSTSEPEQEPKESPTSAPASEPQESPISEPDEAPMSEPEIEEPPISEPEPYEAPMSELEIEESPISEPEPDEAPISEPEIEEPPISEPEPDDAPMSEPEIKEASLVAPEPEVQPKLKAHKPVILPGQEDTGNYTLYKGPFSECSQICRQSGDGYKERSIICRDPVGVHVPLGMCNLPDNLNQKYVERCESKDCGPDYYFILSSWSECSERCATVSKDGTVIPNKITREIECRSAVDNSVVAASLCENLIEKFGVVLTVPCHSLPCDRYGYSTSEWGICNCQTWKQRRKVVCKHWSTDEDVDASFCRNFNLTKPRTERSCYPDACFETGSSRKLLQSSLDRCDFTNCSTKGNCLDGECDCAAEFDGPDCQIQQGDNACPQPSLLNSDGGCCTSGIFNHKGICCDSLNSETDIDIDGNCCDRPIDACGMCSGERKVYDAAGQCCQVMDASGTCCWSGAVDECGVCDGRGNTCNTTITFNVIVNDDQDEASCVDVLRNLVEKALNITVSPFSGYDQDIVVKRIPLSTDSRSAPTIAFSRRNLSLTTGNIWSRIQNQLRYRSLSQQCDVAEIISKKLPICGNRFCEVDEPNNCPQDCDFRIQTCPIQMGLRNTTVMCNGHGLCSFVGSFKCNCFVGYEGENCETCSAGFFRVGEDYRCIPSQVFLNRPDVSKTERSSVETAPLTVSTASSFRSAIQSTTIARNTSDGEVHYWPMVAAGCILLLLVALIVIFVVAKKKTKEDDKSPEDQSYIVQSDSRIEPARDYDSMWQSFNRDVAPSMPATRRHRTRRSRGPSMDTRQ